MRILLVLSILLASTASQASNVQCVYECIAQTNLGMGYCKKVCNP
jgi:hypothetical protein